MITISVDAIIHDKKRLLLVKRNYSPFKGYFCLPGGLVKENETLVEAITREVKEETGMIVNFTKKDYFTYFDELNRDPRFRNITHVFVKQITLPKSFIGFDKREVREVCVFSLTSLPSNLGFDHSKILYEWKERYYDRRI